MEIGGVFRKFKRVKYGVPRGSVLILILFNIFFLNNVFKLPTCGEISSFSVNRSLFDEDVN